MARKRGGPPDGRTDREEWTPPGADEPLQRTLDLALEKTEVPTGEDSDDEDLDFIYGDLAHDAEAEDPITLVVVNVPGLQADEWEIEDGTLADLNPGYPSDDGVIIVVPLDTLNDYLPDWDERESAIPVHQLIDDEIPFAPFPSLRLIRIEDSHLR